MALMPKLIVNNKICDVSFGVNSCILGPDRPAVDCCSGPQVLCSGETDSGHSYHRKSSKF
jgi:hypothetical protein